MKVTLFLVTFVIVMSLWYFIVMPLMVWAVWNYAVCGLFSAVPSMPFYMALVLWLLFLGVSVWFSSQSKGDNDGD